MKSIGVLNVSFALVLALFLLSGNYVFGKECTDITTEISSHTFQAKLLSSENETWKNEVFSEHYHLTPMDETAWSSLIPRKILREEDEYGWVMTYRNMKYKNEGNFLKEVSLHDVRLSPDSKHFEAQQTNLEYLLMLDVDSLVWSFRKTAGLATPGKPYDGRNSWEAPNWELRGHFVGHFLSASALMWASTNNDSLKEKMFAVVSALSDCQNKMGSGYLSAFPTEFFDRFEAIKRVWAPYYTIHKIMAGLLDQHIYANNPQALNMVMWMADYFYNRVKNVIAKFSIERHWLSLNDETGGMNDVLYKLYTLTGDSEHLWLAHLFDKPCFLGILAVKADDISGFHANTHIPVVIGAQMRYEVTGDPLYKEIGSFFMDIVNASHTYATGGTSVKEHWSDPKRLATTLEAENEETCTTYNMLKVSRNLFRWTKEMTYADYYERTLTNGVLSIQRGTQPGVMIYMLPLGRGKSKAISYHRWGTKFDSFWCCYGTGIESFSKLGDSIYFEAENKIPGLYIIQYISSSLNWRSGKIIINQKVEPAVSWDPLLRVTFTVVSLLGEEESLTSTLYFRIPPWTDSNGAKALLNDQDYTLPSPGNFLSITRKWIADDKVVLELPFGLRTDPINDNRPEFSSLQAIFFGPYLLAGLTNGDWDIQKGASSSISDLIIPIPSTFNSQLISIYQYSGNSTFALTFSNNTITLGDVPEPGTSTSVQATFRIILQDSTLSNISKLEDAVGETVELEPFDMPGMVLSYSGQDKSVSVARFSNNIGSVFRLIPGLDGKTGSVSLESEIDKGCYIYSGANYKLGSNITVSCKSESSDPEFEAGASFIMKNGISNYHPLSFAVNGANRNYLLMPLYSLMDEYYTVYFNITS